MTATERARHLSTVELFNRDFWSKIIANPETLVIKGEAYTAGPELTPAYAFRGHSGRRFVILQDGREIVTTNLWAHGKVAPEGPSPSARQCGVREVSGFVVSTAVGRLPESGQVWVYNGETFQVNRVRSGYVIYVSSKGEETAIPLHDFIKNARLAPLPQDSKRGEGPNV